MRRFFSRTITICFLILSMGGIGLLISACADRIPATPSLAPVPSPDATIEQPTSPPVAVQPPASTATPFCQDDLKFVSDITIPDGSVVSPGSQMDKQWLVQNSGDCNWDVRYRLRLISGDALGAASEQALFPARAGTQATLRIIFTAPLDIGEHVSEWQAFDANGIPFGDSFFIKIVVQ